MYKAVLWDFGGVITSSPFEAFNRYEESNKLPKDFIRQVNAVNPETNAWAQLESNQIGLSEFDEIFAQEALTLGQSLRGQSVLDLLAGEIRPEMIRALKLIKPNLKLLASPTMLSLPLKKMPIQQRKRIWQMPYLYLILSLNPAKQGFESLTHEFTK